MALKSLKKVERTKILGQDRPITLLDKHGREFVIYEKAFDSVQTQAILASFQEQGIEDVYIKLLKEIYTNNSMTVQLHK